MEFIQGGLFGKMSMEHSAQENQKALILEQCLKKSESVAFQCLLMESGQSAEWLNCKTVKLRGVDWMPSIGEFPKDARESFLYAVLEDEAPLKYYLSKKACEGILRRASNRGKILPPILEKALVQQIERASNEN